MLLWEYMFANVTVEPPTGTQLRVNAADFAAVTKVWMKDQTADGFDPTVFLLAAPSGTTIYLQDKNDHLIAAQYTVVGPAVAKTGYLEWTVQYVKSVGGMLPNSQAIVLGVADADTAAIIAGPTQTLLAQVAADIVGGVMTTVDRERLFRSGLPPETVEDEIQRIADLAVRMAVATVKKVSTLPVSALTPPT